MARASHADTQRDPDLTEEAALAEGGFCAVAGLDEAGRGAWAGPLVAAAVILPLPSALPESPLAGVRDSKLLKPEQRDAAYDAVVGLARAVGVGAVEPAEIDLLGLTAANELAMVRAVRALAIRPDFLLVDAFTLRSVQTPQRGIVRGDRRCLSIAAASVVAKVCRDRWMAQLGEAFPEYGFERHRGYGAPEHQRAIAAHGLTPLHRLSYAPLKEPLSV